jgi:hypothetical protein
VIASSLSTEEVEPPRKSHPASIPTLSHRSPVRPELVKRATSNQNENRETRPDLHGTSVKRAALNRDSSRASNRLKELCFPGRFPQSKFDTNKEIQELSEDMNRSTLSLYPSQSSFQRESTLDLLAPIEDELSMARPSPMRDDDRLTTMDMMALDFAIKPVKFNAGSRSTTLDALDLDGIDDDPFMQPARAQMERNSTIDEVFKSLKADMAKPNPLSFSDRLTTTDILEIVNEPLIEDEADLYGVRP